MLTNELHTDQTTAKPAMTRERLRQYIDLVAELESLRSTMAELEGRIFAPEIGRTDGLPHGGGDRESSVERGALAHAALVDQLRELEAEISRETLAIEMAIEALPSRERNLMRMHYIEGVSWEEIAQRTNYCLRQVYRLRKQAFYMLETA